MEKKIIRLIIAMTMMLCIVSGLGASVPNPDFDPNARPESWPRIDLEVRLWTHESSQADGTILTIERIYGGSNNPWEYFEVNGYTVLWDGENWVFIHLSEDGSLELTGYQAHLYDPTELGIEKNIRMSRERVLELIEIRERRSDSGIFRFNYNLRSEPESDRIIATCPYEGIVNKVIIYMSFADQDTIHTRSHTKCVFSLNNDVFNVSLGVENVFWKK